VQNSDHDHDDTGGFATQPNPEHEHTSESPPERNPPTKGVGPGEAGLPTRGKGPLDDDEEDGSAGTEGQVGRD
jgi:hypothetical protein